MGPGRSAETRREPSSLEATLQYRFADPSLLEWALTHRSLSYELTAGDGASDDPRGDNEQLEFLGDAVLGLVTTDLLLQRFPGSREGELTRLRASLVSRRNLAGVAARLGLGQHLRLGRGEERSGGRLKPALLANTIEAVLGAVFLDSRHEDGRGLYARDPLAPEANASDTGSPDPGRLGAVNALVAREIVDPAMSGLRAALAGGGAFSGAIGDHKSALQERLQAAGEGQPRYVLAEESGPDHQKRFRIEVHAGAESEGGSRLLAAAEAPSKKEAQQIAARLALEELTREIHPPQPRGDKDAA